MVREPLNLRQRQRGQQLGSTLRAARGQRSMVEIAMISGISVEALRKIETGRIPTPAFFTVAAIAEAVGLSLDALRPAPDTDDTDEPPRSAARVPE